MGENVILAANAVHAVIDVGDECVVEGSPGRFASFLGPASPRTRRRSHLPVQRCPYLVGFGVLNVFEQAIGYEHFQFFHFIARGKKRIFRYQEQRIAEARIVRSPYLPYVIVVINAGGAPVIKREEHMMAMVGVIWIHYKLTVGHEVGARLQQLLSIFHAEKVKIGPALSVVYQSEAFLSPVAKRQRQQCRSLCALSLFNDHSIRVDFKSLQIVF